MSVGVGIIGAGVISAQYLQNLTRFPDVEVRIVGDIDVDRARARAEEYGVAAWGTADDVLADPAVEIVVNLTIPAVHAEVGHRALAAGKHVWTEKPLAMDGAQARALLADAAARGLVVASAPDTMLGPAAQDAIGLVRSGEIGTPLNAMAIFQTTGPEAWHPAPDFLYGKGAGPLFDMGPYYLSALVHALGPVSGVTATASKAFDTRVIASGPRAGEPFDVVVPTNASALLVFASGASAQVVFSFESHIARTGFVEIGGTTGAVRFADPNDFTGTVSLFRDGEAVSERVHESENGRGTGVVDLARAIRGDGAPFASASVALHVLDVMEAIATAAETGERVDVAGDVPVSSLLDPAQGPDVATL